jgi:hypothetical protein
MPVTVREHDTARSFLDAAERGLAARETVNALVLGIADAPGAPWVRGDRGMRLLTAHAEHGFMGAAVCTPPWPLVLADMEPEVVDAIADHLIDHPPHPQGVDGPHAAAERFARRWQARTGAAVRALVRTRLLRLHAVAALPASEGSIRVAAERDRDLVVGWFDAFSDEVLREAPARLSPDPWLGAGCIRLWFDGAGRPVALANRTRERRAGTSIGPVYTAPDARGRGHATALVAALSREILAEGKTWVCLYADAGNPRALALYERIGFRSIGEASTWALTT